jgi:hypothetical protein
MVPKQGIVKGDVDSALKASYKTVSGTLTASGQKHWYMEVQNASARFVEDNKLEIVASTQVERRNVLLAVAWLALRCSCALRQLGKIITVIIIIIIIIIIFYCYHLSLSLSSSQLSPSLSSSSSSSSSLSSSSLLLLLLSCTWC